MLEGVGGRIKELRTTLHLTQKQFATRIGITQAHLSAVENGKDNPSQTMIRVIHDEFDISYKWLNNGEGSMLIPTIDTELLFSSFPEEERPDSLFVATVAHIFSANNSEIRNSFEILVSLYSKIVFTSGENSTGYDLLNARHLKNILECLLDCISACNEIMRASPPPPPGDEFYIAFGKVAEQIAWCKRRTTEMLDTFQNSLQDRLK